MKIEISMATVPTAKDTLPPAIIRASMSRPNWSVPSGCAQVGGLLRDMIILAASGSTKVGSMRQINGPTTTNRISVASTISPAIAPLWVRNWSQTSREKLRGFSITVVSVIANPRVQHPVQDVGNQVEQHDQHRKDESQRLHHRQVVGVDCPDQGRTDAVHLEHLFGDDGAGKDAGDTQRDHRH